MLIVEVIQTWKLRDNTLLDKARLRSLKSQLPFFLIFSIFTSSSTLLDALAAPTANALAASPKYINLVAHNPRVAAKGMHFHLLQGAPGKELSRDRRPHFRPNIGIHNPSKRNQKTDA